MKDSINEIFATLPKEIRLPTRIISFRLDELLAAELDAIGKKAGVTASGAARVIVRHYLTKNGKKRTA